MHLVNVLLSLILDPTVALLPHLTLSYIASRLRKYARRINVESGYIRTSLAALACYGRVRCQRSWG